MMFGCKSYWFIYNWTRVERYDVYYNWEVPSASHKRINMSTFQLSHYNNTPIERGFNIDSSEPNGIIIAKSWK